MWVPMSEGAAVDPPRGSFPLLVPSAFRSICIDSHIRLHGSLGARVDAAKLCYSMTATTQLAELPLLGSNIWHLIQKTGERYYV
jgi:hypothetical protein